LSRTRFDGDPETRIPTWKKGTPKPCHDRRNTDTGKRKELLSSQEREELKALRGEVRELRRANDILKSASAFFAAELDPRRAR
jgi:transposase-like protein